MPYQLAVTGLQKPEQAYSDQTTLSDPKIHTQFTTSLHQRTGGKIPSHREVVVLTDRSSSTNDDAPQMMTVSIKLN